MSFRIFALSLFSSFLFLCCKNDSKNLPQVDDLDIELDLIEFDQILFKLNKSSIPDELQKLKNNHPSFTDLFFESILPLKDETGNINESELIEFISDPFLINIQDTVEHIINKQKLKKEFTSAFRYAKHYFPDWATPNLYLLISGFAYQRFLFEDEEGDAIGIGLDFFLGSDYPYKQIDPKNPAFSSYQTRSFNKDHIVKKALEVWLEDKIPAASTNNLVAHMITNGKKLYILNKLLPTVSDTVITEYSQSQLNWAQENELEVWSFFFDQKLFYETNLRKLNKYINPSPDAPGMPDAAPGRIANYMGWKVVETYMEKNPSVSLEMLILDRDAQRILDQSKYKPKK